MRGGDAQSNRRLAIQLAAITTALLDEGKLSTLSEPTLKPLVQLREAFV